MPCTIYDLCFDAEPSGLSQVSYSLVELPPILAASLHNDIKDGSSSSSWVIKGQPSDDAVLCTSDETYNIRSVKNSNSLLLCCQQDVAVGKKRQKLDIQTTLHQTLELEKTLPKLDGISQLLKDQEWSMHANPQIDGRKRKRAKRMTIDDILELTPASDGQIRTAMAARRIAEIDGYCRPVTPASLASLLQNIISTLSILDRPTSDFDLVELSSSLRDDDEIPEEVTHQTVDWFGNCISGDKWSLRVADVVREIGKQILSSYRNKAVPTSAFMADWKKAVGENNEGLCDTRLLEGCCLVNAGKAGDDGTIQHFSSMSLPADAASRFSELFSVRQKWLLGDVAPFLADLAVDAKKRDALILKFTRKINGDNGDQYLTARTK